ncbi:MAG: ATP-binding protein [Spirochaetales bacterium]|nr:ATP-binding protein [Spirochaetales bacterium]
MTPLAERWRQRGRRKRSVDRQSAETYAAPLDGERYYQRLFDDMATPFAVHRIVYDAARRPVAYRFVSVNRAFERLAGTASRGLIGRTFRETLPVFCTPWIALYERVAASGRACSVEHYSEEIERHYSGWAFPTDHGHIALLCIDVTQRRREEEHDRRRLEETQLLLEEAHHRIKNNMNTVASLLSVQASNAPNADAATALRDAHTRLKSMQVLYNTLYTSRETRSASAAEYLVPLVTELVKVFPRRPAVTVATSVDDVVLPAELLSSLGMITNELVTNAMKHAFVGLNDGSLSVTLSVSETSRHGELIVRDNGIGAREIAGEGRRSGFGMRLLKTLASHSGGTIEVSGDAGTTARVTFRYPEETAAVR